MSKIQNRRDANNSSPSTKPAADGKGAEKRRNPGSRGSDIGSNAMKTAKNAVYMARLAAMRRAGDEQVFVAKLKAALEKHGVQDAAQVVEHGMGEAEKAFESATDDEAERAAARAIRNVMKQAIEDALRAKAGAERAAKKVVVNTAPHAVLAAPAESRRPNRDEAFSVLGAKIVEAVDGNRELPSYGEECGATGHAFCGGTATAHGVVEVKGRHMVMSLCQFARAAYREADGGGKGNCFKTLGEARRFAAEEKRRVVFEQIGPVLCEHFENGKVIPSPQKHCAIEHQFCSCPSGATGREGNLRFPIVKRDGVHGVTSVCSFLVAAMKDAGSTAKFCRSLEHAEAEADRRSMLDREHDERRGMQEQRRPTPRPQNQNRRPVTPQPRRTGATARKREKEFAAARALAQAEAERERRRLEADAAKPENRFAAAHGQLALLEAEQAALEAKFGANTISDKEMARLETLWSEVPALEARISLIKAEIRAAEQKKLEAAMAKGMRKAA